MNAKTEEILKKIYFSAIESVDPYTVTKKYLNKIIEKYNKHGFKKLIVIGAGKASVKMALAVEAKLSELIDEGMIITTYGQGAKLKKIKVYESGHPLPDRNGLKATAELINLLKQLDKNTLVLFLLSGGGSSLLVSPAREITLADKIKTIELLLKSGADIVEMNTVRKHLSNVKGGLLAKIAYPATMISFIISDVLNDRLDVIASGPASPDPSTFSDALKIIEKYNLLNRLPVKILSHIKKGIQGVIPETPKKNDRIFKNVRNIIIANNKIALESAKKCAEVYGCDAKIITHSLSGEAKIAGEKLAVMAIDHLRKARKKPLCLISGGETTVQVRGAGKGGRNQELALAFAQKIAGIKGIALLSAGTDGIDGNTDSAGAIVDGDTIPIAERLGLNPQKYLENNDSYNFFKQAGGLFITGPTGTNVMDVQVVLLRGKINSSRI